MKWRGKLMGVEMGEACRIVNTAIKDSIKDILRKRIDNMYTGAPHGSELNSRRC